MSQKRNLFILLIALFASMHNPAFGMKRQRPSNHTPPPAKRRRTATFFFLCFSCKEKFHTPGAMNQHFINNCDNTRHWKFIKVEELGNDSEVEDDLGQELIPYHHGYHGLPLTSVEIATEFVSGITNENEVISIAKLVAENATMTDAEYAQYFPKEESPYNATIFLGKEDFSEEESSSEEEEEEYEEFAYEANPHIARTPRQKASQATTPKKIPLKELYFEDGYFRCKKCHCKYRYQGGLSQHFAHHHGHASHTMKKYSKRQATPYDREYLHNGTYSCKRCPFNTTKPVKMRAHISHNQTHKTHTLNYTYDTYKREQFYCCFFPDCGKKYLHENSLRYHFYGHPTHKKYLS